MVSTKTKNKIFLKKNLTRKITKQDKVKDKLFWAIYAAVTFCQKIRKVQCTWFFIKLEKTHFEHLLAQKHQNKAYPNKSLLCCYNFMHNIWIFLAKKIYIGLLHNYKCKHFLRPWYLRAQLNIKWILILFCLRINIISWSLRY